MSSSLIAQGVVQECSMLPCLRGYHDASPCSCIELYYYSVGDVLSNCEKMARSRLPSLHCFNSCHPLGSERTGIICKVQPCLFLVDFTEIKTNKQIFIHTMGYYRFRYISLHFHNTKLALIPVSHYAASMRIDDRWSRIKEWGSMIEEAPVDPADAQAN